MSIKFTAGRRAQHRYIYDNKNLFRPTFGTPPKDPLYLTDFKDIEILSKGIGGTLIKCHFVDGTEAIGAADSQMVNVLHQFIYNLKSTPEGQQPEIPVNTFSETLVIVTIIACIFFICMLFGIDKMLKN